MHFSEQNVRGVKRKRNSDEEEEESKEAKLCRKLHQSLRELRKVVKKARTFEVQKTLKRLNDARRKDPESDLTKDMAAQMEILKHLNYDHLTHSAFITKIKKDRVLSANTTIQATLAELSLIQISPGTPGTPMAKVQSRILSSKTLASEIILTLETLKMFLHPPAGSETVVEEATDHSRAPPNMSKERRTLSGPGKDVFSFEDVVVDPSGDGSDEEFENASGDEAGAEVDDGWESGTVGVPSESNDSVAGREDDHDSNSNASEADSPSGNPNSKGKRSEPKGRSEFLPSLSVGFAQGDSGSEFSDSEAKSIGSIRKNRRGQRARRAIWEKKFGKNANHIKRLQQVTERRIPGSVPSDRRSAKGKSSPGSRSRWVSIQSRASTYSDERARTSILESQDITNPESTKGQLECRGGSSWRERPLHPSWEAKRKQKSASILPSQGTKITFS